MPRQDQGERERGVRMAIRQEHGTGSGQSAARHGNRMAKTRQPHGNRNGMGMAWRLRGGRATMERVRESVRGSMEERE